MSSWRSLARLVAPSGSCVQNSPRLCSRIEHTSIKRCACATEVVPQGSLPEPRKAPGSQNQAFGIIWLRFCFCLCCFVRSLQRIVFYEGLKPRVLHCFRRPQNDKNHQTDHPPTGGGGHLFRTGYNYEFRRKRRWRLGGVQH